ncbi:MAG: hypothetical protein ACRDPO_20550 [Streptosporangiaceae bacterium]
MNDPAAAAQDETIGPGQYRYIHTDAWWMTIQGPPSRRYIYLAQHILQTWIPPGQQEDWLHDRQLTGRRTWIKGSEQQAEADGVTIQDPGPTGRWRAPHGDFFADPREPPGTRPASWQHPTPQFLDDLPRNPAQLHQRLITDSSARSPSHAKAFTYATDALRTGLIPADLRAALYQAMLMIPGTDLTGADDDSTRPPGWSLRRDNSPFRDEIFISRADAQLTGERSTVIHDIPDLTAGTLTTSTITRMAVTDSIGGPPAGLDDDI